MTVLLHFVEAKDSWMRNHGEMEWRCHCDAQVGVSWASSFVLYDTDDPIGPDHPLTSHWSVDCHNGHVLLHAHELADDMSSDTCEPPTTAQIVERLASTEDVAAWLAWRPEHDAGMVDRRRAFGAPSP